MEHKLVKLKKGNKYYLDYKRVKVIAPELTELYGEPLTLISIEDKLIKSIDMKLSVETREVVNKKKKVKMVTLSLPREKWVAVIEIPHLLLSKYPSVKALNTSPNLPGELAVYKTSDEIAGKIVESDKYVSTLQLQVTPKMAKTFTIHRDVLRRATPKEKFEYYTKLQKYNSL